MEQTAIKGMKLNNNLLQREQPVGIEHRFAMPTSCYTQFCYLMMLGCFFLAAQRGRLSCRLLIVHVLKFFVSNMVFRVRQRQWYIVRFALAQYLVKAVNTLQQNVLAVYGGAHAQVEHSGSFSETILLVYNHCHFGFVIMRIHSLNTVICYCNVNGPCGEKRLKVWSKERFIVQAHIYVDVQLQTDAEIAGSQLLEYPGICFQIIRVTTDELRHKTKVLSRILNNTGYRHNKL